MPDTPDDPGPVRATGAEKAASLGVSGPAAFLYWRGHPTGWLLPTLIVIVAAVVEVATDDRFRAVSWMVLAPGVAAALCSVRGTALLALFALATYVLITVVVRPPVSAWPVLVLLVIGGLLAVFACVVRISHAERLSRMSVVADTTRRAVLRPFPPGLGGLEQAALYLPANSEARVGGDFYDIQPSPWGTRVVVGDVQGKGLEVVETAAALLGTFREAGYHERSLAAVASRLEIRLKRQVAYRLDLGAEQDRDRFATAVMIGYPAGEPGVVEMVNFGHEPPLLISPDGTTGVLPGAHGLPLGMSDIADLPPPVLRVPIPVGATLLLTTDGVTEARNAAGDFYPLREEVTRAAARDPALRRPEGVVRFVREGVLLHSGGHLEDDTTIFSVRRPGPDEPPPWERSAREMGPYSGVPPQEGGPPREGRRRHSRFRLGPVPLRLPRPLPLPRTRTRSRSLPRLRAWRRRRGTGAQG
ncbi:PP2C family protein-serine/threonine phosphatase [Streptomyces sp. NPDC002640]